MDDSDIDTAVWREGDFFIVRHPLDWNKHERLIELLDEVGADLAPVNLSERVRQELWNQVREHGVSAILARATVQESLVAKGVKPNSYATLVASMIAKLALTKHP